MYLETLTMPHVHKFQEHKSSLDCPHREHVTTYISLRNYLPTYYICYVTTTYSTIYGFYVRYGTHTDNPLFDESQARYRSRRQ